MASAFIGYTVLVTLTSPPNARLQGVVVNVIEQRLILQDGMYLSRLIATNKLTIVVTLLWNNQYHATYHVEGSAIADLEVSPQLRHDPQPTNTAHGLKKTEILDGRGRQELRATVPNVPQKQKTTPKEPFVDPAILSFTKPAIENVKAQVNVELAASPKQIETVPTSRSKRSNHVTIVPTLKSQRTRERRDSSATATLTEPFDHMAMEGDAGLPVLPTDPSKSAQAQDGTPQPVNGKGTTKQSKKVANRKSKNLALQTGSSMNDVNDQNTPPLSVKKGKGWRQTPLTEDPSPAKPDTHQGRSKHKGRKSRLEDPSGWATEEATDIQDLGDFDFESNLSKFDKRRVFDDIRKDDTTADDERLVSFNRKARPGTNGGKNLHFTENVLELTEGIESAAVLRTHSRPEPRHSMWNSEGGESEEEAYEGHYSSGRGSRRNTSRKPIASRKSTGGRPTSLIRGMSRIESPRPSSRLSTTASPINGSTSSMGRTLRLSSTNKPCACVSPLHMLEIEQLCISELAMTEEMLAENAGRGIAEACLTVPPASIKTPTAPSSASSPTNSKILFLIGNHKSGARAIAGARHLRNRGLRVVICLLGGDREDLLLESVRKQLDVYKKGGGWVTKWDEFQTKFSASGESPAELVVDALLGTHVAFEDLRMSDQAIAFEMTRWANRSALPILSVDIPSGMDGSNGEVTHVDDAPLMLQSRYVACLGAPKTGLLQALAVGEGSDWQLMVIDIGISKTAWRKFGSRRRHGIDFGMNWVVPLKYVDGVA